MKNDMVRSALELLLARQLSPLDLLPHEDLREKLVELVLSGEPVSGDAETGAGFQRLRSALEATAVADLKVVVFGGGTGLSNLIGGDSRSPQWPHNPFVGLKEVFPQTRAIVCVTDDGGSTGELQKDLPLIALGDLRHVLLSSMQSGRLQARYGLSLPQALEVVAKVAGIFNYRFQTQPQSAKILLAQTGIDIKGLPASLRQSLVSLTDLLFSDPRLLPTLTRPHCLGNLLLAAAIYAELPPVFTHEECIANPSLLAKATMRGLTALCTLLGAEEQAILPCTTTQARLSVLYANGVQVRGENKSGYAQRWYPVERIFKEFCEEPFTPPEVFQRIAEADILIMAPGSLYSSLIPVFQVPGLAEAVRDNTRAMKLLVSNLWVQAGETDQSMGDADQKFFVSDLLKAYDRNIPGGIKGLFDQTLCLSLKDVPASILQHYAVEGKIPIYLDRDKVCVQAVIPIECGIFSRVALAEQGVIQHGPNHLARVVKTLWAVENLMREHRDDIRRSLSVQNALENEGRAETGTMHTRAERPLNRHQQARQKLLSLIVYDLWGGEQDSKSQLNDTETARIRRMLEDILWKHQDIPLLHLDWLRGVAIVEQEQWVRNQTWDNVFSFYDPADALIKIRADQALDEQRFEVAFLVALGQSLLGNYALSKEMRPLLVDNNLLGKVYHLRLRPEESRSCYFSALELGQFLHLTRLLPVPGDVNHFTRVINGNEGFSPPGMLMGLLYAWYLDNRFASHIEYKMAVMKIAPALLVPEQVKMLGRRQQMIRFFREVVFRHPPIPEKSP